MSKDRKGWICPACGRGVSPDEKTCDHRPLLGGFPIEPPIRPLEPYTPPASSMWNWDVGRFPVGCAEMRDWARGAADFYEEMLRIT